MPMYRVLRTLSRGHDKFVKVGTLTDLAWLKDEQRATLEMVGAVSRISAPPLAQLPGWKRRAERLGEVGLHTVDDVLAEDAGALAEAIKAKPSTVEKWQTELVGLITVPQASKRG